jgi:2'-5' RNA ligase
MSDPRPLIVTAALDEAAFDWFQDLRRAHYPAERNQVPAHLTLFHALPGKAEAEIAAALKMACAEAKPMRLDVRGPWSLGRGVAFRVESEALERLRSGLAARFEPWLVAEDRTPFRPHITIQNKADPEVARRLLERLQAEFEPFDVLAEGLLVWRYRGGPWEAVARLGFGGWGSQTPS